MKLLSVTLLCLFPLAFSLTLTEKSFKPCGKLSVNWAKYCWFNHLSLSLPLFLDVSPGKIQSVTIEPCSAEPCTVSNGNSIDISTTFISSKSISLLRPNYNPFHASLCLWIAHDTEADCVLKGSVLFASSWYEILSEPACGGDVTCPLVSGSTYTLKKTLAVTDTLPVGSQQTRWKLICNNAADEIFCGDIAVNVA